MAKGVVPKGVKEAEKGYYAAQGALETGGEKLGAGAEQAGEKAVSALGLTGKGREAASEVGKFGGGAVQGVSNLLGGVSNVGGDVSSFLFGDGTQPTAQLGPASLQYLKEQQAKKAAQQQAAQQAANAQGQKDLAGKPGLYGAGGLKAQEDLFKTVPTVTTPEQDVEALLKPYMDQMTDLGPEYQKEMDFLTPYMAPNQGSAELSAAPAYTGPDAAVVNKNQTALNQADQAMMTAYQNMPKPGFGAAAADARGYEQSLLTQAPIQAALNYQRYLGTYGGQPASTQGWSPDIANAYAAILGSSGAGPSGLPGITSAAAAQNANNLLNTAASTPTPSTPGK